MAEWNAARAELLSRYIDGQLDAGESAAFEQQLAADPGLCAEAEQLRTMRSRLRAVVHSKALPDGLHERVLAKTVNRSTAGTMFGSRALQFAGAFALTLLLVVGGWMLMRTPHYILSDLPPEVAAVMEIGIGKHVSCVKERLGSTVFGLGKFNSPVPLEYQRMIDAAQGAVPADFKLVEIHMCGTRERRFAHLVVARGDNYLSLLLTPRKDGDPEPANGRYSVATVDGISIFAAGHQGLEVGAFALPTQYAFVVSDMDARENLEMSKRIAGAIN